MKNKFIRIATSASFVLIPFISHAAPLFSLNDDGGFKRFSVSVGALHVMPQGNLNPIRVNSSVPDNTKTKVGDTTTDSLFRAIDRTQPLGEEKAKILSTALDLDKKLIYDITLFGKEKGKGIVSFNGPDGKQYVKGNIAGEAVINGISEWDNPNTGLQADNVTTLGIMSNYFFTDNVSLEIKAGIPPKVDLKGTGAIDANIKGKVTPIGVNEIKDLINAAKIIPGTGSLINSLNNLVDTVGGIPLNANIPLTNFSNYGPAATARAWTPAAELQYHFGKTGVNKFRPYLGVGVIYAYFNELKLNPTLEQDLLTASHRIANIRDGKAGAALDGKMSTANPQIKVDAKSAFAPVATVGFTYDFYKNWFAVGSVSYAPLSTDATILMSDQRLGEIATAKTKIEINPILAYAGIGLRF